MNVAQGDRIELVSVNDPFTKLKTGDKGTVVSVKAPSEWRDEWRINVDWDSGSSLSLLPDEGDQFRVVQE